MMNTKVACTVDTCVHWSNGNACSANSILVQGNGGNASDQQLRSSTDAALSMSSTPACDCCETQCRSFKQK